MQHADKWQVDEMELRLERDLTPAERKYLNLAEALLTNAEERRFDLYKFKTEAS